MKLFFDPDHAMSYRELQSRLERITRSDAALAPLATRAGEAYATALQSRRDRDVAWRGFIAALRALVNLAILPSSDVEVLHRIVDENSDLLSEVAA